MEDEKEDAPLSILNTPAISIDRKINHLMQESKWRADMTIGDVLAALLPTTEE